MSAYWVESPEEKEELIEKISNYDYEKRPTSLYTCVDRLSESLEATYTSVTSENPQVGIVGQEPEEEGVKKMSRDTTKEIIAVTSTEAEARAIFQKLALLAHEGNLYRLSSAVEQSRLLEDYQKLKAENEYCRSQLSTVYTPERLQRNSILFGFLSLGSLILSTFFNINILNPIAAYLVFGISFVFFIMSMMMKKEEKK